ncbi:hypothetical protein KUTeg_007794 [Tegillarca granosa]|uniref:DDE-1 domain-containing protein n=1 Tax=Tegillarca granosa TaxID=220873 RepID=A0ABQ9FEC5_TEGGR|nr:hypothetical protein KUTeg_007794 [Tegillarca granosa]
MIANYVSEMALRGMGLGPSDIIDLVQEFLKKEKRKTPFKDNRPSYTWYYGFMGRHFNKLEKRKETLLEASRSKVTPQAMDNWFDKYRKFLSDRDMLDKPERIWNADETSFTMGSKAGNVIGPSKTVYSEDIPHVSGGSSKQRLTVMYCVNAEGNMLPPFFVYPEPKPTAYDPLIGAAKGSRFEYTPKGWMDATTFSKFIDHFDANVDKTNRPTLLLLDSGSGIYPVNREAISQNRLKPSATFDLGNEDKELDASENENNSTLKSTPDQSSTVSPNTLKSTPDQSSTVSPLLVEILKLPQAKTQKPKPKRLIDSLPYSLTSSDSIRKMALDKLNFARNKAKKEKTAKERYLKKREKELSKSSSSEAAKPSISRKCVSTKRSKARPSSAPSKKECGIKGTSENAEIIIKNSVIKGYHAYEIRPPMTNPPTRLIVDLEYTNIHDEHASLIWVPELSSFNDHMHCMVTDMKRYLKLSDVAGLPMGHAPRGLSLAFRNIIEKGYKIYSIPTGEPGPIFPPWPPQHAKGGGIVIPCDYIIKVNRDVVEVNEIIRSALSDMPERDAMAVEIIYL